MRTSCEFSTNFKSLKTFMGKSNKIDFIIFKDSIYIVSETNNVYNISRFEAVTVTNIVETITDEFSLGVSILSDLFLKLPSKNKGLDTIIITEDDGNLLITVNSYTISKVSEIFDKNTVYNILKKVNIGDEVNMDSFNWISYVAKGFKNSLLHFVNGYAICGNLNGFYVYQDKSVSLKENFAVTPTFMTNGLSKQSNQCKLSDVITMKFEDDKYSVGNIYRADTLMYSTFKNLVTQKFKVKIKLNLSNIKTLVKSMSTNSITLHLSKRTLVIESELNERLEITLGKELEIEIANLEDDMDSIDKLSNRIDSLTISSSSLLRNIAMEQRGVTILMNDMCNVVKFGDGKYFLFRQAGDD